MCVEKLAPRRKEPSNSAPCATKHNELRNQQLIMKISLSFRSALSLSLSLSLELLALDRPAF